MSTHADVAGDGLPADGLSSAAAARQERLAERVTRLRTRAGSGGLDRWLLVTGGVLVPLGFLLIVLGWLGAAHTVFVFEQIPYMVSGGLLGLALVFAGGFIYFAYWQTLLVRDTRAERRELTEALHRIETLLANGSAGSMNGARTSATSERLVATETGSMIHRPDCPVVLSRDNLRTVDPSEPGLRPCRICDPLDEAAAPHSS